MYSTSDFRKGLKIEINGEPFTIVDFLHVKPGKGGAFVRTTLKSLISGNVIDRTFRSGEKLDKPDLEEKQMQFLYESEGEYHFMDSETYEQLFLTEENLGDARNRAEARDLIVALPRPTGPATDTGAVASSGGATLPQPPVGFRVVHVPTLSVGLDVVLERRRGHRY